MPLLPLWTFRSEETSTGAHFIGTRSGREFLLRLPFTYPYGYHMCSVSDPAPSWSTHTLNSDPAPFLFPLLHKLYVLPPEGGARIKTMQILLPTPSVPISFPSSLIPNTREFLKIMRIDKCRRQERNLKWQPSNPERLNPLNLFSLLKDSLFFPDQTLTPGLCLYAFECSATYCHIKFEKFFLRNMCIEF